MGGTGVIDHFLEAFTRYIDGGFGLLGGEVGFIATTLIVIDVTLAALFWSWGADDDIMARLVKKTLFVGVFAYLISNWNNLARIIFESFAGLGLKASGTGFAVSDLMRPGKVAQTGLDAGRPLLDSISNLMGYWSFFENFIQIACMFFAWALVLLAFFILAIQLFVTLIEFKLTTLAGFVLIPFGLFGKSAFMAERVLGNVISSGVKVMVLAVIVGIGAGFFDAFVATLGPDPDLGDAMTLVLGALTLAGLLVGRHGIRRLAVALRRASKAHGLILLTAEIGVGRAAGPIAVLDGLQHGVAADMSGLGRLQLARPRRRRGALPAGGLGARGGRRRRTRHGTRAARGPPGAGAAALRAVGKRAGGAASHVSERLTRGAGGRARHAAQA